MALRVIINYVETCESTNQKQAAIDRLSLSCTLFTTPRFDKPATLQTSTLAAVKLAAKGALLVYVDWHSYVRSQISLPAWFGIS